MEIREAAREGGLMSITQQAVDLVLKGEVSVGEAYRTCYFGNQ